MRAGSRMITVVPHSAPAAGLGYANTILAKAG
jgi:hypothetical protein